jgi:hypothetical protein
MFDILALALGIAVTLYVCYLVVRAYKPSWFSTKREAFVAPPTRINTPPMIPAPAPPVAVPPPQEERVIAPGGPSPPAAAAPDMPPVIPPEAKPVDPYDDRNMEAPIKDSMRQPELSFGPGVDNKGMNQMAVSGVGNAKAMSSESPFSPEFAQNGGQFMGSVFANDLTKDDRFASF